LAALRIADALRHKLVERHSKPAGCVKRIFVALKCYLYDSVLRNNYAG
jgi:hypothetical protein